MTAKAATVIQRIVLGAAAIAFLLSLFITDHLIAEWATERNVPGSELLRRGSVIPVTFVVLLCLGAGEMMRLLRVNGQRPLAGVAFFFTAVLVVLPWLGPAGFLGDSIVDREGLYWSLVGMAVAVMAIGGACVMRKNPEGTITDGGATLLVVMYLGFLGSLGLQLRTSFSAPGQQGVWLLFVIIMVTKSSDIGAYLIGTAIGRHKLIPSVSPGKTVEGAVGGLLASGLVAVFFAWPARLPGADSGDIGGVAQFWDEMTRCFGNSFPGSGLGLILRVFGFGIIVSFFAQLGDLFESCFKRDAGIKDSGSVLPHYGGILDLVDSPLFALPVAWFLLTRVWNLP